MPPSDLLSALLNPVRAAAHEDSTQALDPRDAPATRLAPSLVNTRATAHALGGPMTTVDRVCRRRRILYVRVPGHKILPSLLSAYRPKPKRARARNCVSPRKADAAKGKATPIDVVQSAAGNPRQARRRDA
jgi:hypothetical protein